MKCMFSLTVFGALILFVFAFGAGAQVPNLMYYQGHLTDEEGSPLDTVISMTFAIYDDPIAGGIWWSETQDTVMVVNGLFHVLLGSVNGITDTVFMFPGRWLGITIGLDPEISPRTELVTVPWAFRVSTVDGASGGFILSDMDVLGNVDADGFSIGGVPLGTSSDSYWSQNGSDLFYNLGNVGIGTTTPAEALDVEGNIHTSGTFTSGSSITIDGTTDQITSSSGTIDFDDENIITTGKATIGLGNSNTGSWAFVAGRNNTASSDDATIGGGSYNVVEGFNSAILGGYADTIGPSADYSYLFGIGSRLDEDSTFMVDMPHIVFEGDIIQTRPEGDTTAALSYFDGGGGFIGIFGPNGTLNAALTLLSEGYYYEDHGALGVANADGDWRVKVYSDPYYPGDRGVIETLGPNGNANIKLWNAFVDRNAGCVSVADAAGAYRGHFLVTDDSVGMLSLLGPNNYYNVVLTNVEGDPNRGSMGVCDNNGWMRAEMFVDELGQGIVFGDQKSFRISNPNQPGTDIWYCCLEGPEAAAYVRGTGHLVNGRADVSLPDHFTAVASLKGITVQVTPLSAESKGLAVLEKSPEMFAVRELNNGNGTYDFDFMVTAVRKGYEDYKVIRPEMKMEVTQVGTAPEGSEVILEKGPRR